LNFIDTVLNERFTQLTKVINKYEYHIY